VPPITSRQHGIVKAFRAVARGDENRALVDGWHLLHEAGFAGVAIDTIAVTGTPRRAEDAALIEKFARQPGVFVTSVSPAVMSALSPVRTPSGVAAIVRRPHVAFAQLLAPAPALVVVASNVQDPGNAGAIIRAAEAGGATGVVVAGESADAWSWKALRASMGSTFRLPVYQQRDALLAFDELRGEDITVIGAVPHQGQSMHDVDLRSPVALVFGGEGSGLSPALLAALDLRVSIPMQRPVDSLNVAVAAGVLVYEARRQRG
jgi:RNA methyltransferase, TrmH family